MSQHRAVESWDDDADFAHFTLARNAPPNPSSSMVKTSASSRHSIRSESNAGEDDWHVQLSPNDDMSIDKAISSAKDAGIPIPANIPSSALLGGQIRRLGNSRKKKSQRNLHDDWGEDLELPNDPSVKLKIKPPETQVLAPSADGFDELEDWAEGSLGVRFGGTRRGSKNRSSSASAMSPSLASIHTLDSEEDGLTGLILPSGPLNFEAHLRKRKAADRDEQTAGRANATKRASPAAPAPAVLHTATPGDEDNGDFFAEIDIGNDGVFDPNKRTLNRNVKSTWRSSRDLTATPKAQTTLTFTDKATTRIPRPVSGSKPVRLEPVFESGATNITRPRRSEAMTTSAQLLRSKRSMPALRSHQPTLNKAPSAPFLNGGHAHSNSYHLSSASRPFQSHLRHDSDSARPQSPTLRSHSRLSTGLSNETPTRLRRDVAPTTLAREAAAKRSLTRPARRRNFGDGTELDCFDDLPTSATKESRYVKSASSKPIVPKYLRQQTSQGRLGARDRMTTPLPPLSPIKSDSLPRFARDTAASRIAREQTLGPAPRVRGEPFSLRINNWNSMQTISRSPQQSPNAKRSSRKGPTLINPMGKENNHHFQDDAAKKGMHWNSVLCRWEGNDQALVEFEAHRASSPPRPALISNMAGASAVQVVGGMVFDPQRMCWLKMRGALHDAASSATEEEEDPFRGIDDLQDGHVHPGPAARTAFPGFPDRHTGDFPVGEEFDLGPEFIRRQREEEVAWRMRTSAWSWDGRDDDYKWAIRQITMQ